MRKIKKLKSMPYAQAHIEVIDNKQYLFSYYTLVATIEVDKENKWIRCYGLYSATTRKHISAFARENGLTYQDFKGIAGMEYELNIETGEIMLDGCKETC